MTVPELLIAMDLGHLVPKDSTYLKDEVVQVELPDETYRNIKEIFYIRGKTVIRLENVQAI